MKVFVKCTRSGQVVLTDTFLTKTYEGDEVSTPSTSLSSWITEDQMPRLSSAPDSLIVLHLLRYNCRDYDPWRVTAILDRRLA